MRKDGNSTNDYRIRGNISLLADIRQLFSWDIAPIPLSTHEKKISPRTFSMKMVERNK